jgi:hypothetical protein
VQVEHAPCADPDWIAGTATTGTLGTPADPRTGRFTTYNFEVAQWHTYFAAPVGSTSTHASAWVHNLNVKLCEQGVERAFQGYKRHGSEYLDRLKRQGKITDDDIARIKAHDPQDTTRDRLGRLHDSTGKFARDPHNPPSPHQFTDADRRREWKRLADDPNSGLTPAQRQEIRDRGYRGPRQRNEFGELETLELSHEPVPLRHGGTNVVPRWPGEHAAVDSFRRLKKR